MHSLVSTPLPIHLLNPPAFNTIMVLDCFLPYCFLWDVNYRSSLLDWKMTETKLNPTAKDQTTSCSCTNSENFQLPLARFVDNWKTKKTQSFIPLCAEPYSHTNLLNFWSFNHRKWWRIGWDMVKNIFIHNSNICPFCFPHISTKS